MSPCPACGAQGHHVAIVLPWKAEETLPPGKRLLVQHRCPRDACPQGEWFEAATDEQALLRRITRALQPSPLAELLAKPAVPSTPADVAAVLRKGVMSDPSLLLHATAWMVFGAFGVTEENRHDVHAILQQEA